MKQRYYAIREDAVQNEIAVELELANLTAENPPEYDLEGLATEFIDHDPARGYYYRTRSTEEFWETVRAYTYVTGVSITPEGNIARFKSTTTDMLQNLWKVIECETIDVVSFADASFYIDDTGLIDDKPYNLKATLVAIALGLPAGIMLHGTVVVVGPADIEGYDTSLDAVLAEKLLDN